MSGRSNNYDPWGNSNLQGSSSQRGIPRNQQRPGGRGQRPQQGRPQPSNNYGQGNINPSPNTYGQGNINQSPNNYGQGSINPSQANYNPGNNPGNTFGSGPYSGQGNPQVIYDQFGNPIDIAAMQAQQQAASEKAKELKQNKKRNGYSPLKIFCFLLGLVMVAALGWFTYRGFYSTAILNPPLQEYNELETGRYALQNWQTLVNNFSTDELAQNAADALTLEGMSDEDGGSYLAYEVEYANGNESRLAFLEKICSTVGYDFPTVQAQNIYGGPAITPEGDAIVEEVTLNNGESCLLSYIDYSKIKLDEEKIQEMMREAGLRFGDVDFSNKITDLFCDYIVSLDDLPLKTEERVPELIANTEIVDFETGAESTTYVVSEEEDAYLDRQLFSSDELFALTDQFSILAIGESENPEWEDWQKLSDQEKNGTPEPEQKWSPEWEAWNALSDEEKAAQPEPAKETAAWLEWNALTSEEQAARRAPIPDEEKRKLSEPSPYNETYAAWEALPENVKYGTPEPEKVVSNLVETDAWKEWDALSEEDKLYTKEPEKYFKKDWIKDTWCGAYHLAHYTVVRDGEEVEITVTPNEGKGTVDAPASIGTPVISYIRGIDADGNSNFYPIRVTLLELFEGQEAINFFESKDTRNRGMQVSSLLNPIAYRIEVENLSDVVLTVYDDSSLADSLANLTSRTGNLFGFQDKVTLLPDEVGVLECWASTPDLQEKYLIWGKDFKREQSVAWFAVLAASDGEVHIKSGADISALTDENGEEIDSGGYEVGEVVEDEYDEDGNLIEASDISLDNIEADIE